MENQYGKRSTSKKHNLLNCDFDETLSYKVEIDQDIIDYLKCRNGIVYLVYKITKEKKNFRGLDNEENLEEKYNSENEDLNMIDFENIYKKKEKEKENNNFTYRPSINKKSQEIAEKLESSSKRLLRKKEKNELMNKEECEKIAINNYKNLFNNNCFNKGENKKIRRRIEY